MIISIVNRTKSISDEQLQNAIRAINRQIREDFEPYWSFGATLRLEGSIGDIPDKQKLPEMRGDAILYLWDEADTSGALGYHEANFCGIPYGFVFTELCAQLSEPWTVTLSHEALELLADAQGNLLTQGPHPEDPSREVFHWYEMCDAVQAQSYFIDGVAVSNFVLPLYFTVGDKQGGRNDFLGRTANGKGLHCFGVSPGGYIGFYDPQTRSHVTYAAPADAAAIRRMKMKSSHKAGRGYLRKHGNATVAKESEHTKILCADATAPVGGGTDPIRHVVVLMLENRSFDHMLGDATRIYPGLEGIPQHGPRYSNTSNASKKTYPQAPVAAATLTPDPNHEHDHVLPIQLGTAITGPMGGFVDSYLTVDGVSEKNDGQVDQVMAYFPMGETPADDSLPALHALARNFLVCDHWFSSMPGPTWPNRFFAHSGTSLGHVLMPSRDHPEYMRLYDQDTIYGRLSDADRKWRIYHDGMPQSIVMTQLLPQLMTPHYQKIDQFFRDAIGPEKDFPDYCFIEPNYFSPNENDQHPPSDIAGGDLLISEVYNALRANEALWASTLLIVTYDEHGGFFDHVSPPVTVAPDEHTDEFSFTRLGVRVPAILVSPWVPAGVCKTVFDHTSILRYACDKWGMPPLGRRTAPEAGAARANSLLPELTRLSTARQDAPPSIGARPVPRALQAAAASPVDGSREALLWYIAHLPDDGSGATHHAALPAMPAGSPAGQSIATLSDAELRDQAEQRFHDAMQFRGDH